MPTLFSCLWAISNVRERSWFPLVVVNRNESFPTPGQLQMSSLLDDGWLGPPVQRCERSRLMTFFWSKPHFFQFGW